MYQSREANKKEEPRILRQSGNRVDMDHRRRERRLEVKIWVVEDDELELYILTFVGVLSISWYQKI